MALECLRCSRLDDDGCVISRLRRCLRRLSIGDDDIGGSDGGGSVRSRRRHGGMRCACNCLQIHNRADNAEGFRPLDVDGRKRCRYRGGIVERLVGNDVGDQPWLAIVDGPRRIGIARLLPVARVDFGRRVVRRQQPHHRFIG
ncbi:hypothetical protein BTE77_26530 [Ensifer adhaerens]|nr:hypothetical protein BTE77_26530 [Ensifer adhaerens]